jgi:hypothetical protein
MVLMNFSSFQMKVLIKQLIVRDEGDLIKSKDLDKVWGQQLCLGCCLEWILYAFEFEPTQNFLGRNWMCCEWTHQACLIGIESCMSGAITASVKHLWSGKERRNGLCIANGLSWICVFVVSTIFWLDTEMQVSVLTAWWSCRQLDIPMFVSIKFGHSFISKDTTVFMILGMNWD